MLCVCTHTHTAASLYNKPEHHHHPSRFYRSHQGEEQIDILLIKTWWCYLSMFKIRATAGRSAAPQVLPAPSILQRPHFSNLITSLQPPWASLSFCGVWSWTTDLAALICSFVSVQLLRRACVMWGLSKNSGRQSENDFGCCLKIQNRCSKKFKWRGFIKSRYWVHKYTHLESVLDSRDRGPVINMSVIIFNQPWGKNLKWQNNKGSASRNRTPLITKPTEITIMMTAR